MKEASAIHFERVGMSFIRGSAPLFNGVDLKIGPGEVVGIVGPNGVGKTTLLNIASLLLRPTEGEVRLGSGSRVSAGEDGLGPDSGGGMRVRVGRSFQRVPVVEGMPAWRYATDWDGNRLESFRIPLWQAAAFAATPLTACFSGSYRRRRETVRSGAQAAFERLGIAAEVLDQPVDSVSLGLRRLIDVLRALAMSAGLFVLDEPFANLRPATAVALAGELRRVASEGVAGLVADHSAHVLGRVATRMLLLTRTGLVPL